MFNIVVTMNLWVSQWCNLQICIKCNNIAVVEVMASECARDEILFFNFFYSSTYIKFT